MPKRKRHSQAAGAAIAGTPVKNFRQRYNDLEQARTALLERLDRRMKIVRTHPPSLSLRRDGRAEPKLPRSEGWHPSAKRALKLLNTTFRNAKVAQRAAILQSAEWLITLIEMTPPMV
jgi:hypothetical protein